MSVMDDCDVVVATALHGMILQAGEAKLAG
jgi:hypothetical protein